jgi:phosphatidate cytidylyltransferase
MQIDKEHAKRLKGGLLIAFMGFGALTVGGLPFTVLCVFLIWLATKEMLSLTRSAGAQPTYLLLQILCPLAAIVATLSHRSLGVWFTLSCILIICNLVVRSFYGPKIQGSLFDLSSSLMCLVYIGWLPASIVSLRFIGAPEGLHLVQSLKEPGVFYCFFPLFCVMTNDIASYYAGKAFGRTKLAASISPNKTIKGSIAGVAVGSFVAILLGAFVAPYFGLKFNLFVLGVFAVLMNILAQLGDLAESLIKRSVGVKDAGQVIEGHGGVLDRFDSHLLAANLAYYFFLNHYLNYFGVH